MKFHLTLLTSSSRLDPHHLSADSLILFRPFASIYTVRHRLDFSCPFSRQDLLLPVVPTCDSRNMLTPVINVISRFLLDVESQLR